MDQFGLAQSKAASHDRRYHRFNLEFPVRVKFLMGVANVQIDSVSKNLSIGGLLIRSTIAIPTHTELTFTLSVYGKEAVRPTYLVGEGEVVRIAGDEKEENFLVAVECKVPVAQLEEYLPM
jgi:PilZ domain-containing protein